MLRRMLTVVTLMALAGCTASGDFRNPFVKEKPFVPSAVPSDFTIVVDENHEAFTQRQHIQQVITSADAMSRTTYANIADYSNTVRERFTQETPLSPSQLQAMWNEVSKNNLLQGSTFSINWRSDADLYKKNEYVVQIHANGMTRTLRETNGFPGKVRPLMLLVGAVRLPITQHAEVPVVGSPDAATAPAGAPAMPAASEPAAPATAPASAPATQP